VAVRMQDVADLAGVSARTVSNVVNGFQHVSPATRERVQRALDELGYEMNAAARSLKSGRTGMVALVVSELHAPYFAELADAVVRGAGRRSLTVLVEVTEGSRERELKVLEGGRNHLADGALVSPVALREEDFRPRRDFPLVLLGESRLATVFDHVGLDNVAATQAAVNHLIDIGRTNIAAVGWNRALPAAVMRKDAFLATLGRVGLRPHSVVETADWERHTGASAVETVLTASGPRIPDAIFAFNDTLAVGALRALSHHGIKVPSEVAVVGIDNIDEAAYTTPSLTSIAPDLEVLADDALALLEDQITRRREGGRPLPPRQRWTPFRLVVRESTLG
jgi:DNA-binding LacI/PurR family transcriptional regulator